MLKLPMKIEAAGFGFMDKLNLAMPLAQPLHQTFNRFFGVRNGSQRSNFALPASLSNGDRDRILVNVQADIGRKIRHHEAPALC